MSLYGVVCIPISMKYKNLKVHSWVYIEGEETGNQKEKHPQHSPLPSHCFITFRYIRLSGTYLVAIHSPSSIIMKVLTLAAFLLRVLPALATPVTKATSP